MTKENIADEIVKLEIELEALEYVRANSNFSDYLYTKVLTVKRMLSTYRNMYPLKKEGKDG